MYCGCVCMSSAEPINSLIYNFCLQLLKFRLPCWFLWIGIFLLWYTVLKHTLSSLLLHAHSGHYISWWQQQILLPPLESPLHRMPMSWFGFSAGINVWWGLTLVDPPYCCNRERGLVIGTMNPGIELIVLCHSGLPMGNRTLIQGLWFMLVWVASCMGDRVAHISPARVWTSVSVLHMFMGSY